MQAMGSLVESVMGISHIHGTSTDRCEPLQLTEGKPDSSQKANQTKGSFALQIACSTADSEPRSLFS